MASMLHVLAFFYQCMLKMGDRSNVTSEVEAGVAKNHAARSQADWTNVQTVSIL